MKCQNCGKNEVNFHYSSNVNGCVTETHLCSECAAKTGYGLESMFDTKSILNGLFAFSMNHTLRPMLGFSIAPEYIAWPQMGLTEKECACGGACGVPVQENPNAEIDGEMQKRREVNVIREQMRLAAEREDFEKAAQLRDQIRQLEAGQE